MKSSSRSDFFKFTILKPAYYLDALLFWAIYTSSTMLILWLLTATAKNQLRETLATQFVKFTQQTVDVLQQQENLKSTDTRAYLKTATGSYPEIVGLAVVSWAPGQPIRVLNSQTTKSINFDSERHVPFLDRTARNRQLTISDWPIFIEQSAAFLTPPSRPEEFIYSKLRSNNPTLMEGHEQLFLISAYDSLVVQHGFFEVEELGIATICISILLGTVFAIFVRFRSAQRLKVTEEKTRALETLRKRDMALNRVVNAADLLLGPNEIDGVFSGLLKEMAADWGVPLLTALVKNRKNEMGSVSRDYRFIGPVPEGQFSKQFTDFSEKFPQFWERIEDGEVLNFSRRHSPVALRLWMRLNGINQIAVAGLIREGGLMGLLVAGADEAHKLEDVAIEEMLKLTADIFSAAYQQRSQEELMRESSKMEALGRVAGGVAHEFNNLLHIIKGNLKPESKSEGSGIEQERVGRIAEAATRGARIVEQLLEGTRMNTPKLALGSLNRVAERTIDLAQSGLGAGVEFKMSLKSDIPDTLMDDGQIQQVILNLLLNACDACPQGGVIELRTGLSKNRLFCEVWDNGPGISDEDVQRLFEPFFTTKDPGKGTGLGLSTSRGIMELHGGSIEGGNSPAGGALFRFYLPIRKASSLLDKQRSPKAVRDWDHGEGPVYIADDEVLCLGVLRECFEEKGVAVIEFESGTQMVEHLEKTGEQPDWIVTDFTMPGLHGLELVRRLRELCPRSVLIVTSGFALRVEEMPEIQALVSKPFTPEELFEALAVAEEHRPNSPGKGEEKKDHR